MERAETSGDAKSRILVVDDDPFTLETVRLVLAGRSLDIVMANNGEEAQNILSEQGTRSFDVVLSDFRMPGISGLDLLTWISDRDVTLGTLILTGEGDKEVVTSALRRGACDYLEKPFKPMDLRNRVRRAINVTLERRELEQTVGEVRDIELIKKKFTGNALDRTGKDLLKLGDCSILAAVHPIRESGGDFYKVHSSNDGRLLLICGDVSGHDLKASFISAYFEGIFDGMLEMGASVDAICRFFNKLLVERWNSGGIDSEVLVSLSCAVIILDPKSGTLQGVSHGLPLPMLWSKEFGLSTIGCSSAPLGWTEPLEISTEEVPIPPVGTGFLYTDGLEDLARDLRINLFALAYLCLHDDPDRKIDQMLRKRRDDVMVIQWMWDTPGAVQPTEKPDPCYYNRYAANMINKIDSLQKDWDYHLQLLLPRMKEIKRHDVLLCIREAMLNAMEHGCKLRSDLYVTLTLALEEAKDLLLIRVDDEGSGFSPKPQVDIDTVSLGEHISLGCTILQSYAQSVEYLRGGATLMMKFSIRELANIQPSAL